MPCMGILLAYLMHSIGKLPVTRIYNIQNGTHMSVKDRASGAVDRLESERDRLADEHDVEFAVEATNQWADNVGRTLKHGQMSSRFTMMVQAAVTLAVGVLIVGSIFGALPTVDGPMSDAANQTEQLTGTAFELAPIVLIVIVAALVLRIVRGL